MYNLINSSTGQLLSNSIDPIESIKEIHAVVETADNNGIWNAITRVYDAYPVDRRMSKADFFKAVGLTNFSAVVIASKNDIEVEILLQYINGLENIDMNDPEMIYGLGLLVSKGVWNQSVVDDLGDE